MHDFLSECDELTQILLGLRLDGVEYGRCVMRAPWAIAFPAQRSARFHFVGSGGCWLRTPSTEWKRLNPGDAVLLPRGSFHILASAPDVPTVDIDSLARVAVSDNIYLVGAENITHAPSAGDARDAAVDATPPDVMFCGALRFNLDPLHPLLTMMPDVMFAGDIAKRDVTVPALLDAMEREVALDRIGACGILARLADVLAASIIRAWVECGCSDATGWIAAVRCPKIGKVIAAIHAAPERDWSVPMLADVMGSSRSSFAEAFTRTMGESPAKYVAKVKMFQARHWIANDGMRIAVAADRLGYDSEASFSRAFKRVIGHPPSASRVTA
ncbi:MULTISPECIES: AraC family transcriptional regulator [unclassified Rhizobacter]|uniref:AraC family transcriptional regulator n=1 Tax=unclassified Rhizobacter TaxID=2640088 RepID=UPI0006F46159|nr:MULTISPECIES: AraC family transcriptional regulator [unclassified Rhizobacter]KQU67953.1 AraC family transcriptional regulator [Rhizobacter sp. Root29]KQW15410.1 AraC family transcriptional regulator [Rhizobacter sp. Root1238]KRB24532.1 AraC family transcriptional regulator [Rhizobacter sp. Root16D2]